ncbi:DUF4123 domain-containing protein [uncultured Litoreibacter sp.]|uniref:DUF4123 domain-containing protein n=1 Tax=uncultured Litoreibacter sp. TaxID=1392394 RepID=UPI0026026015|nr:DUF4123 domain-containing protein [uncultured Litoreibacter sp.]
MVKPNVRGIACRALRQKSGAAQLHPTGHPANVGPNNVANSGVLPDMWRGKCVFETDKDRFIAETEDHSAAQSDALANREAFVAGQGGRMIVAGPLEQADGKRSNPALRVRTTSTGADPLRLTLAADQRPVDFEVLALPDGPAALEEQLFDPALQDVPPAIAHPAPGAAPVEVFALIDAACNPMMPEALAGYGADHVCLFGGETADELSDVAPWLARLEPGHPLTGALLSGDEPPLGHWPLQSAVFLCSRIGLPALRRNLRKFTRMQREDGNPPYYFRFYDPSVFRVALPAMTPDMQCQLLAGIDLAILPADADGQTALRMTRGGSNFS